MEKIWLIGCGQIGIAYSKVLEALGKDYLVIGRGNEKANIFEQATGRRVIRGGLRSFLDDCPQKPDAVIVAVNVDMLQSTTLQLLDFGAKKILVEKPGVCFPAEIGTLSQVTLRNNARVFLAYNRRFYSSVIQAGNIIEQDGGVQSFNFEFTEWSHIVENLSIPNTILNNWFLANSSHVVDTAFFLGGIPYQIAAFHQGGTKWHPRGSVFSGAGISKSGALFSYHANWQAPGRWAVEILTKRHRLYLKPMEKLQVQHIGSIELISLKVDDQLDVTFKPGFYLQTKAFLDGDFTRLCSIEEQKDHINSFYHKISGY